MGLFNRGQKDGDISTTSTDQGKKRSEERVNRSWTPEFYLVFIMLVVLTVLVLAVLWVPIDIPAQSVSSTAVTDILEYRKTILAIIITAFGAWVGAGAAYFFGRENMREASQNFLAMREQSLKERLRSVSIRDIPPKQFSFIVKQNDEIGAAWEKLKSDVNLWFVPIVDEKGALESILHEEAVWRFLIDKTGTGAKREDVLKQPISDLNKFIDESCRDNLGIKKLRDTYVRVTPDKSVSDANGLMQDKEVSLAVVVDESGKPTGYVTFGDVRRVMFKVSDLS